MTLEEAQTVSLYFLFNGDSLSLNKNSVIFIEASKVIEAEASKIILRRSNDDE